MARDSGGGGANDPLGGVLRGRRPRAWLKWGPPSLEPSKGGGGKGRDPSAAGGRAEAASICWFAAPIAAECVPTGAAFQQLASRSGAACESALSRRVCCQLATTISAPPPPPPLTERRLL